MLLEVLPERQGDLLAYVKETYTNVRFFVEKNWLRLDFNQDGSINMDDLRKSVTKLYEFLKSFNYLEATTRIKSSLYAEAIKLLPSKAPKKGSDSQKALDSAPALKEEDSFLVEPESTPLEDRNQNSTIAE